MVTSCLNVTPPVTPLNDSQIVRMSLKNSSMLVDGVMSRTSLTVSPAVLMSLRSPDVTIAVGSRCKMSSAVVTSARSGTATARIRCGLGPSC